MCIRDSITWVGVLTPPVDIEDTGVSLTVAGTYTDIAGNSGTGATTSYDVDTIAPTASVSGIAISNDTGTSDSDFLTSVASQTITGTLSVGLGSGEILYGSVDNGNSWTDITDKLTGTSINWDGATLSGTSAILIKVSDTSGNAGPGATPVQYKLDTQAPVIGWSAATDDQGSVTGGLDSGDSTDDLGLVLSGTNGSGSIVSVYNGSALLGTATVSGDSWSFNAQLQDGVTYQFNVIETDHAGNISVATSNFVVTGDTTAPAVSLTAATIKNTGNTVVQSTETGTVYLVNTTVTVSNLASITGAADNLWNSVAISSPSTNTNLAATGLADGTYKAYAVDLEGNLSSASRNSVIVDNTAPTANFTAATDDVGNFTGALTSGSTTDDTALVLSGSNESGSSVKVYNGSTELGSATVSGTSSVSYTHLTLPTKA